jgi:hypothetical protein
VKQLAVIAGSPHQIDTIEDNDQVLVALDDLFAALRWETCAAAARCVLVPPHLTTLLPGAGRRHWSLAPSKIESVAGRDFADISQLEPSFGLRAGWDRIDGFLWVVVPGPPIVPSRSGENIPIPAKNYGPFDSNGIPMKSHGNAGVQYNPLVVLEYATIYFRNYLDTRGDRRQLAAFFRMIDWLDQSAVAIPGAPETAAWYYDFNWPPLATKPFLAGITQSYAGSAFLDAYILTGDSRYLNQARRAMAVLKLPVQSGGVYSTDKRGESPFLEEYPSDPPSRVLGGCADTVLRLGRYLQFDSDPRLKEIYSGTIATLRDSLHLYDAPEALGSRYALSQEVMFHLITDQQPVTERHPISAIRVLPPDDRPYELLIGKTSPTETPGYRIVPAPSTDWSLPALEAGRVVRAFESMGATYKHAVFYVRLSGFLVTSREQVVEIDYRDVSTEAVHLEVYSNVDKKYTRLGTFEAKNDGRWKTLSGTVTPELLGQTGIGLLPEATGAYPTMHITWLRKLAAISGEARFAEFASKWENYLDQRQM